MTNKKYINFGAGNPVKNWINLDSSPFFLLPVLVHKVLVLFNLSQRSKEYLKHPYEYYKFSKNTLLPFKDNSISVIYTSHVLEHLSIEENEHFFNEAKRILKKNGIVRVIVPDLENKIKFDNHIFSIEKELLTLPQELKSNKIRAMLEAFHGFPSFHKSLFVKSNTENFFSNDWIVSTNLNYLESMISKKMLKTVEQKIRVKNAFVFELVKK
jgi:predicted SAM-dependent methyltransferase